MPNPTTQKNNSTEEIERLEAELRVAELSAQKAEARVRMLEAEEKIREIQTRRLKQLKKPLAR